MRRRAYQTSGFLQGTGTLLVVAKLGLGTIASSHRREGNTMSKQKGNDSAFGVAAGSVFDRLMGADIARCTNEQCAVHDSCMRWIFKRTIMRGYSFTAYSKHTDVGSS